MFSQTFIRNLKKGSSFILAGILLAGFFSVPSFADYNSDMEARKELPVATNEIENWPVGPKIGAYSAIVMEVDTGSILYAKNIHKQSQPASTTKLMTTLLAIEKEGANLNDVITFSYQATNTLPWDASVMGVSMGEQMTLEDCLYSVLVVSANDVSIALSEYVSGSEDKFVELMNERASELGCINTKFSDSHGYALSEHYTSAYDLALIAREFFKNELLSKISGTSSYRWTSLDESQKEYTRNSTNYFLTGRYDCDGIIGSKTGFTDDARACLVTCAERNGMRLICVVMMEETPYQYLDTNTLFEYAFNNFEKVSVSDYNTKFNVTGDSFFHSGSSLFGNQIGYIALDKNATLVLPKTIKLDDCDSKVSLFESSVGNVLGTVSFSYNNVSLGTSNIVFTEKVNSALLFSKEDYITDLSELPERGSDEPTFIYVNYIIYAVIALFVLILIITLLIKLLKSFHFAERRRARRRWRTNRRKSKLSYRNSNPYKKPKRKRKDSSYISYR